jgi:hypothetical protein
MTTETETELLMLTIDRPIERHDGVKRKGLLGHYSSGGTMNAILKITLLLVLLVSLAACNSTTVLLANFNTEAVGAPPAFNQPTGTVVTSEGAGSVRVAASPESASTTHWLRISHPTHPTPETVMRARFDSFHGAGHYVLLASVFIPTGTGAVTLQLEPFGGDISSSPDFLHLDFMPQNNVRLNDNDANRFGTFPRDQSFVVSIQVDTTVTPAKATISLFGAGATGSKDVVLPSLASQFGAVRIWMGFQWTGTFFVDDILVTRQNS